MAQKDGGGLISLRGVISWSLRGHWTVWYPWILVVVQAIMIISLLVVLENQSMRPVRSCDKSSIPPTTQEFDNLVNSVHFDDRILKDLPIPDRMKNNPTRLFYNRVPKCGTHTLLDVIMQMARIHNYTFARSSVYMTFHIDDSWKEILANQFMLAPTPLLYERHLHFLRFNKYNAEQPVYFNMIRDPLERMVSWYYFRRYQYGHERHLPLNKRIMSFDECVLGNYSECIDAQGDEAEEGYFKIIPFFCGQEDVCRTNSELAFVRAIQNVKEHYAVVGVAEQYAQFIEVLEHVLPTFFRGVTKVYQLQDSYYGKQHETTYKLPVSREVAQIMYPKLKLEYKFYNFIKGHFQKLYTAVKQAQEKYPSR